MICGDPFSTADEKHIVTEDDLITSYEGQKILLLRLKNCTGNIIIFSEKNPVSNCDTAELTQSQIALSIDPGFKNARNRTIRQAVQMVARQRIVKKGYYDFQIRRYVRPLTLGQAAINLGLRHHLITGENQHIEGKTLTDYQDKIICGSALSNPYNFHKYQGKFVKHLRRHCKKTRTGC